MSSAVPMEEARRLVVQEGLSYKEAATLADVPLSTLQKRAAAEDWQAQRKGAMSYGQQVRALKARMLTDLLEAEGDTPQVFTQKVLAWQTIEKAYPESRYNVKADPKAKLEVAGQVIELLVRFLGGKDRNLVTALQPFLAPFGEYVERELAAA